MRPAWSADRHCSSSAASVRPEDDGCRCLPCATRGQVPQNVAGGRRLRSPPASVASRCPPQPHSPSVTTLMYQTVAAGIMIYMILS